MNPPTRSAREQPAEATPTASPTKPPRRRRWRRVLFVIIGLLVLLLLLVGAVVVFRDQIGARLVKYSLEDETGMPAEVGAFQFRLSDSSVRLVDLKITNPPEFGGAAFIEIPEIYLKVATDQSSSNLVVFDEVRFHLATVNVVKNEQGQSNLDLLKDTQREKKKKRKKKRRPQGSTVGGIEKLTVSLGVIRFIDLRPPGLTNEMNLNVDHEVMTAIKSEDDLNARIIALLMRVAMEQYQRQGKTTRSQLLDLLLKGSAK